MNKILGWPVLWAFCLAMLLASCTSVPAPKTADQTVASAYASYAAVNRLTAASLATGRISVATARDIQAKLRAVRPMLDLAQAKTRAGQQPAAQTLLVVKSIGNLLDGLKARLMGASHG